MLQSIVSRKRMVRSVPPPELYCPLPPEPRRMWKSSSTTGKRNSSTSGSVSRELVMWLCTPSAPLKPVPSLSTPAGPPAQIVS